MVGYYFKNVSNLSVRDGDRMEKKALDTSTLAIYSSHWAADAAVGYYKSSNEKVKVIPFGANVSNVPNWNELDHKLDRKIKLLFVGKDWERKGGKIAFDTMKELNQKGVETNLTVVGCIPPVQFNDKNVTVIPFLDKNKIEDRNELRKLYLESNFFIMPSRMEAYGIVFCEAAAFGLPVLSTITGGIPTIVKDGVNGYLLPLEADGKAYAEKIIQIISGGSYRALCISSRKRYDEVLNWDAAGKMLSYIVKEIL